MTLLNNLIPPSSAVHRKNDRVTALQFSKTRFESAGTDAVGFSLSLEIATGAA